MSRDQRVKDNWALLYACEVAERSGSSVVVAFNLVRICTISCVMSPQVAFAQPSSPACSNAQMDLGMYVIPVSYPILKHLLCTSIVLSYTTSR